MWGFPSKKSSWWAKPFAANAEGVKPQRDWGTVSFRKLFSDSPQDAISWDLEQTRSSMVYMIASLTVVDKLVNLLSFSGHWFFTQRNSPFPGCAFAVSAPLWHRACLERRWRCGSKLDPLCPRLRNGLTWSSEHNGHGFMPKVNLAFSLLARIHVRCKPNGRIIGTNFPFKNSFSPFSEMVRIFVKILLYIVRNIRYLWKLAVRISREITHCSINWPLWPVREFINMPGWPVV